MAKKRKWYSYDRILSQHAIYNVIFGQRSNGKTYGALKLGLQRWRQTGAQFAYVRRWADDLKKKQAEQIFGALEADGFISEVTGGEWTGTTYYSGRWYFCRYEEDKRIRSDVPFCFAFAISQMEHDKSASYPGIETIIFDEFLTRTLYLPNEFVLFMNVISTIVRDRNNVQIFMLGNSVNQYAPYFTEMGLTNVKKMKPGDLDLYHYGESELTVAVEFADAPQRQKPSDVYFAFDNPRLGMITGAGTVWEMSIYPHLPEKYKPMDVVMTYFIQWAGDLLQCEVICKTDKTFTFIHRKTGEIKHEDDVVFSPEASANPFRYQKINSGENQIVRKIFEYFQTGRVFYQDNEVGEIVRNYLQYCGMVRE